MNINFEYYKVFYVIAKNKNITKAANELNISQPAISRMLKTMEEQLNTKLFIRKTKGVMLTQEGNELYNLISNEINNIINAENDFSKLINNKSIKIAVDKSILNYLINEHKLDMIEMADNLAKEVNEIYPELESATKRRQVYARLSTLNQMLYAKGPEFEQKRREIINYVNRNSKEVAKNPRTPKRDKLAFLLLKLGYPVYRFCWLQYRKKIMNN